MKRRLSISFPEKPLQENCLKTLRNCKILWTHVGRTSFIWPLPILTSENIFLCNSASWHGTLSPLRESHCTLLWVLHVFYTVCVLCVSSQSFQWRIQAWRIKRRWNEIPATCSTQKHVYNLSLKKLELDMYHLISYVCSLEINTKWKSIFGRHSRISFGMKF